jgi:beta-mannosidase
MSNDGLVVGGWQMQDVGKVHGDGREITEKKFSTAGWYSATVPGTVLTTLVDNHVYPDPMYGENNRANVIPESLAQTSFWYRTELTVPRSYAGRHVWLHFDGINYSAIVWVSGKQVGTIRGAFNRGTFDISDAVQPGTKAVLAVLVSPQPHPGVMHEHTLRDGVGRNGGVTALDGPTFLSTIGWDWLPTATQAFGKRSG